MSFHRPPSSCSPAPSRRRALLASVVAGTMALAACSGGGDAATSAGAGATAARPGPSAGGDATTGRSAPSGSSGSSAGGGGAAKFAGFNDPTYADGANWLCGPGLAADDRCLRSDLDVTVVKPDGATEIKPSTAATDPTFDCFYVYPTVNLTQGPGTDDAMAADPGAEEAVTRAQAARLREVCRVFAPLYRQNTLSGYASNDRETFLKKAYGDVHNAFRYYMAHANQGRPVLLVGHSQGSGHLQQLLKDEFDGDEALRQQLVSAMLLGGPATLKTGSDAGGSFQNLPACRTPTQTGCVIGFNSTAADTPASDLGRWGKAPDGQTKLCTNPGNLAGGPGPLTPIVADQAKATTTPWVAYPGALTAECKTIDGATTLVITATPGDKRDLREQTKNVPGWGLHINEVNLTQGDLVELARTQGAAKAGGG